MQKQKNSRTAITPIRSENYAEWYLEVIKKGDLADYSKVRGSMVIKPWGYAIWENIRTILDKKFQDTGHENAYFPLFIPLSYLEKEAEHVDGFAKECAVVTHHRLEKDRQGKLVPAGELEEPLIVRPTSEMIIGDTYARWVQSYRDLPILINQWANVVRWEMRTRMFLRTTEFLWQEGHTVHETEEEAKAETKQMLDVYVDFCKNYLAMPTIFGRKTEEEKFPGAVHTYTLEAMMQDRKALQAGTSHFLGQNFAKSCGIEFQTRQETLEHAWTTSWGVTTRLIGAMVMMHSDDNGLVLPPKIAAKQIVILPILGKKEKATEILSYAEKLKKQLEKQVFSEKLLQVHIDKRDLRGGEKMWSWVKKGAPIRVEIGPSEWEKNEVSFSTRIDSPKEKKTLPFDEFVQKASFFLDEMQESLFKKALSFLEEHTKYIDSLENLYAFFTPQNKQTPEIHGGFALAYYHESASVEKLQEELGVTIRCLPFEKDVPPGSCILSGKKTACRAIFAKAY